MSDAPVKKTKGNRVGDGTPGPGRPKGVANKTTKDVREFIANLARNKGPEIEGWLTKVAAKDPGRALEIYTRMIEYHIPKLGRTELVGDKSEPLTLQLVKYDAANSTES